MQNKKRKCNLLVFYWSDKYFQNQFENLERLQIRDNLEKFLKNVKIMRLSHFAVPVLGIEFKEEGLFYKYLKTNIIER